MFVVTFKESMGKSIKNIGLRLSFLLVVISTLVACKKEVPPSLLVTVVDPNNNRINHAWVEISVDGANAGIINSNVIASGNTDRYGTIKFEFDNTVLVDVALYRNSSSNTIEDSTSVLLETERSRDDDNLTERKLVIY
jgi:microcompartment protein CcmK/EutM